MGHKSMKKIVEGGVSFLKNEFLDRGFERAVVGLSGGVDSAVVAILAKMALCLEKSENLKVVLMPSLSSSSESIDDSMELIDKFNLNYEIVPIRPYHKVFLEESGCGQSDVGRIGNFCARLRMATLYDISYAESRLVVGTSNKSELMLGYGTIFGDLAYSINPIGDIYKSDIFELARYIGIPETIVSKSPSADLFVGQSDEGDLGYSYQDIDKVLKDIEMGKDRDALLASGYDSGIIDMIFSRISKNRYKLQSPKIFRVGKSFVH